MGFLMLWLAVALAQTVPEVLPSHESPSHQTEEASATPSASAATPSEGGDGSEPLQETEDLVLEEGGTVSPEADIVEGVDAAVEEVAPVEVEVPSPAAPPSTPQGQEAVPPVRVVPVPAAASPEWVFPGAGGLGPLAPPGLVELPSVSPKPLENTAFTLLPWIEIRGFSGGLWLALGALAFVFLARLLNRIQEDLEKTGLLPRASRITESLSRLLAVAFGLGAVAAWIPANLAPLLQWILIAAALALGWSLREWLQDWVAWTVLASSRHMRAGRWIRVGEHEGEVLNIGFRTTLLVGDGGLRTSIPNRFLISQPVGRELERWPRFKFELRFSQAEDRRRLQNLIYEAISSSPWVGDGMPRVEADPAMPGRWWVEVPLLSGRFQSEFRGSLRGRILRALEADAERATASDE